MEHSAVLLTCIKVPHGFKTFVLYIFESLLKTGFTVSAVRVKTQMRQIIFTGVCSLGFQAFDSKFSDSLVEMFIKIDPISPTIFNYNLIIIFFDSQNAYQKNKQ